MKRKLLICAVVNAVFSTSSPVFAEDTDAVDTEDSDTENAHLDEIMDTDSLALSVDRQDSAVGEEETSAPLGTFADAVPVQPPETSAENAKTGKTTPLLGRTEPDDAAYVESNVISIADRSGFKWSTKRGDFVFHPYVLVQTRLNMGVVDDEGLNLADPDNVVDFGFGIPAALFGIAGKAFDRLAFNLTFDGACAGKPCLLNQAWLEGIVNDAFRIRVGKFKTPMHWTNQVRIGQTLAPVKPVSLTTRVNVPFDINAANPVFQTGFDLGIMAHGMVGNIFEYQAGIFNGEGNGVNMPTSTLSDDIGIPAWLYGARFALTPLGPMPLREGGPSEDRILKLLIAASASYNVEANAESSNDLRGGVELALSTGGLYWGTEAYMMHLDFVERQEEVPSYLFYGAYTQLGYLFKPGIEPLARMEVFDRNSVDKQGVLVLPSVGLNYYMFGQNLKFQALYQYLARAGHEDELSRNDDDNGMSEHTFVLQVQFVL